MSAEGWDAANGETPDRAGLATTYWRRKKKKLARAFLLVALACYTIDDLRRERCDAHCVARNHVKGFWENNLCYCADTEKTIEVTRERAVRLPRKVGENTTQPDIYSE